MKVAQAIRQKLVLRPYQELARSLMHEIPKRYEIPGVQNQMDLGLGKTPTALTVMDDSLHDFFDTTRWLVVGPKLVVEDSWPTQLDKWEQFEHLSYRVIDVQDLGMEAGYNVKRGKTAKLVRKCELLETESKARRGGLVLADPRATKERLAQMQEAIHLVSWNNFPHLVKAYGSDWPYDGLVLDESEYTGDSTGLWHKAARHVIHRLGAVKRVIELSGLPSPNGLENLHGQILLLDGGQRLGVTKEQFHGLWMEPAKKNWQTGLVYSWKVRQDRLQAFHDVVKEVAFSMTGGVDLPEWAVNDIPVTLKGPAEAVYRALVESFVAEQVGGGSDVVAASEGVLVQKLQQVCSGAVYDEHGNVAEVGKEKLDRLAEVVSHLDKPVVIAYLWDHEWPRIAKRFPGIKNLADKGVLAEAKAGKHKIVAGQCQAFSHGVDGLQHVYADVIWTGPSYNYGTWEQLRKRFHRDGQKYKVMVHRLIAKGTIEEYIANVVLPGKKSDAEALLGATNYAIEGLRGG